MSDALEFIKGVDKLHAFYTENVRMERGIMLLDSPGMSSDHLELYDFRNVARSILRPPRVDMLDGLPRTHGANEG